MRKLAFLLFLLVLPQSPQVRAANGQAPEGLLNKLLAPGPLIEGHKNLEKTRCLECHAPRKGVPDSMCLECHQDIREQVHKKNGFHGLTTETCISCHSDHKGRDFDSDAFDPKTFDHAKTGYPLIGKHAELKCAECHTEKRSKNAKGKILRPDEPRYTAPTATCVSCHKKDDVHFFARDPARDPKTVAFGKKDCSACHGLKSWKEDLKFNHTKDAHFELEGKHAKISCAECHVPKKTGIPIYHWKNLKQAKCLACHEDIHQFGKYKSERLGNPKDCVICHGQDDWHQTPKFDHNVNTRYPIAGKHLGLECNKCHTLSEPGPHRVYFWKNFPKDGCAICHKSPHTETFSPAFLKKQCTECHNDQSWATPKKAGFDHNKTRFSLTGKHLEISCEKCHQVDGPPGSKPAEVFRFKSADEKFCIDCHKNVHTDQFHAKFSQQACANCHGTEKWEDKLAFDHSKTSFALAGKHFNIDCVKCHKPSGEKFDQKPFHAKSKFMFPEMRTEDCAACHKDVHEGRYGKQCSSCHDDQGWKTGKADFHKNFTLKGVHFMLQCNQCHVTNRVLAGQSEMCISCHKKDDIHNGALPDCGKCHDQFFWEHTTFKHSMTNFPLRGAHRTLDCATCHANGVYRGLPSTCASCHQNEAFGFTGNPDHHLLIGRNCAECHNQFSFQ
jgi:hypothetical protein